MVNTQFTDSFQRPASYWLKRAERSKQAGNLLRAVVLERHATRAEPASTPAAVSYALTLRQMHCYEASNREAFAALARDPGRFALYGLIGQNLMELGNAEGAMDAVALYMSGAEQSDAELPPWDADVCELEEAYWEPAKRRRARYRGLCRIALTRIVSGDLPNARRALARMSRPPYQGRSAQRELLKALYFIRQDNRPQALRFIRQALRGDTRPARVYAMAASLLWQTRQRRQARAVLLRAACLARDPADTLQVCLASDQLECPQIALAMLRRALTRKPDRYPVCYNLGVCLLRLGRLEEAGRYIHFCRELDPDDISGELLFAQLQALEARALPPEQLRRESLAVGYYGTMTPPQLSACLTPLLAAFERGVAGFARQLSTDDTLRRRYLHTLSLPDNPLWQLLPDLIAQMPTADAECLLREILLQGGCRPASKRAAATLLHQLGVRPPYAMCSDNRLMQIDPTAPPAVQAAFLPRRLTRALARAGRLGTPIPWGMAVLTRLPRRVQLHLAGYPSNVVAAALCVRCHHLHTHCAPTLPLALLRRPLTLKSALRLLRQPNGKGE